MASIYEQCKRCVDLLGHLGSSPGVTEGWGFDWVVRFLEWTAQELVTNNKDSPLKNASLTLDLTVENNESLQHMIQSALETVEECLKGLPADESKRQGFTDTSTSRRSHDSRSTASMVSSRSSRQRGRTEPNPNPFEPTRLAADPPSEAGEPGPNLPESTPSEASTASEIIKGADRTHRDRMLLNRMLDNLFELSTLTRRVAKERPLPARAECPDLFEDTTARVIYLRAWDTVTGLFPFADIEMQKRQAVALSITVSGLIRDKQALNMDGYGPRYSAASESTAFLRDPSWPSTPSPRPSSKQKPHPAPGQPEGQSRGRKRKRGGHSEPEPSRSAIEDIWLPIPVRVNSAPVQFPTQPQAGAQFDNLMDPGVVAFAGSFPMTFNTDQETQTIPSMRTQDEFRHLGPYVCVFTPCQTPYKRYESQSEWELHIETKHMMPTWICPARGHQSELLEFKERSAVEDHMVQFHKLKRPGVRYLAQSCERRPSIPQTCRFCLKDIPSGGGTSDPRQYYLQHTAAHFGELVNEYMTWMSEYEILAGRDSVEQPLMSWERSNQSSNEPSRVLNSKWIHTAVDVLVASRPLDERASAAGKFRMPMTGKGTLFTKEPEPMLIELTDFRDNLPLRSPAVL